MANKPPDTKTLKTPIQRNPFLKSKYIQSSYERALRRVAKEVWKLIKAMNPYDPMSADKLKRTLYKYAEIIEPWANYTASSILEQVNRQDLRSWKQLTKEMSIGLRKTIEQSDIGDSFSELMQQNVKLIKSIPEEAAERVHKLVTENLYQSVRADEIAKKIMATEGVTLSRATLIARTETSRASTLLTQARANSVGSEGYIWRTSQDKIVRESHRQMNGKFVKWTEPPTLDKLTGHAGALPNCRCWPDPVVPD